MADEQTPYLGQAGGGGELSLSVAECTVTAHFRDSFVVIIAIILSTYLFFSLISGGRGEMELAREGERGGLGTQWHGIQYL